MANPDSPDLVTVGSITPDDNLKITLYELVVRDLLNECVYHLGLVATRRGLTVNVVKKITKEPEISE